MVKIYYFNVAKVTEAAFHVNLLEVPARISKEINEYPSFNRQKQKLFGRLIVKWYHQAFPSAFVFDWADLNKAPNGKPFLAGGNQFSISYAGDLVVVAFFPLAVGVDLELIKEIDIDAVSSRLNKAEMIYIDTAANKMDAFYHIWTRKEAFLKATGQGLLHNLARHNCLAPIVNDKTTWYIRSFSPIPNYKLAACTPFQYNPLFFREMKVEDLHRMY